MGLSKHFLLLFFGFLILLGFNTKAQNKKYVVYFKDKKGNNPFSLSNPSQFLSARSIQRRSNQNLPFDSTDLPVSPSYLDSLRFKGAIVLNPLKWLNAAIVDCPPGLISSISTLPFVISSKPLNSRRNVDSGPRIRSKNGAQSLEYGDSFAQNAMLGIDSMHAWGFHGENMLIAVMDAGFQNVNNHLAFSHLFENQKILGVRDLVARDGSVYEDHWHGGAVLSNIAAYYPNKIIGGAYASSFYLIRSEDAPTENEIECAYWVAGLELADSIGADILNSSLGYTTFDTQALDYSISMLDGKTTIASRAASMAARKGIVVVCSAGNEGNNSGWGGWLSAPSDADSILCVGSVNSGQNYSSFSGKGPTADNRIKPDVVAMGSGTTITNVFSNDGITTQNGTSFSAPIITGFVAGFWQAHPEMTAKEIISMVKNSGSNKDTPNNQIGWGLPNFIRAHILTGSKRPIRFPFEVQVYPNPNFGNELYFELIESNAVGLASFEITDVRGVSIMKNSISFDLVRQAQKINISYLKSGVYSIKLEMGGKVFSRKIILQ
jgi:serine protease AprX